jgi:uncharacterized protein with HEPN domain
VTGDSAHVDHILECIDWIGRFTAGGRTEFMADRKTRSAVLRELQTPAESTQRLSQSLKDAHPQVFWQGIAGFRNVLVHNYLGIDPERVWQIVQEQLPALRRAAEAMRQSLAPD